MSDRQSSISIVHAARIIGLAVLMISCVVVTAAALIIASDLFLILFLAILFGVFLVRTSHLLEKAIPLGYSWCLSIIVTLLILTAIGGVTLFGVQVNQQLQRAKKHLDESRQQLKQFAQQYPIVNSSVNSTPFARELLSPQETDSNQAGESDGGESDTEHPSASGGDNAESGESGKTKKDPAKFGERQAVGTVASKAAQAIASIFDTTFGFVVNSVLIFFVGLFLASAPQSYRDGLVVLLPKQRQERARDVLNSMGATLWRWLLGRFGSMLITGAGAAILLVSLGVPMGITLGIVTGLLTFIPNIGSAIALLIAILFALPQGGAVVLSVVIGYLVLQIVESYVVTPLIQQQQVSLPPALLISTQAIMGVLFGFLGAAVASPALAVLKKAVQEVYIKDVLGQDTSSSTDGS